MQTQATPSDNKNNMSDILNSKLLHSLPLFLWRQTTEHKEMLQISLQSIEVVEIINLRAVGVRYKVITLV